VLNYWGGRGVEGKANWAKDITSWKKYSKGNGKSIDERLGEIEKGDEREENDSGREKLDRDAESIEGRS
jgi:hypothetical protein